MADNPRALLAGLPVASIPMPPGHVAIVRAHAPEAGALSAGIEKFVVPNLEIRRSVPFFPARPHATGEVVAILTVPVRPVRRGV